MFLAHRDLDQAIMKYNDAKKEKLYISVFRVIYLTAQRNLMAKASSVPETHILEWQRGLQCCIREFDAAIRFLPFLLL